VYTDLAAKDALVLEVDGKRYEVAQFSSNWAVNEIPTAVCLLAIGRKAQDGAKELATIHTEGRQAQMTKAKVIFQPRKEYDLKEEWTGPKTIFDGFFVGFSYRKISDKVYATASLIHWLAAMTFSSCLTATGHVANPTELNAAAVLNLAGGTSLGGNISSIVMADIADNLVGAGSDLWKAISAVFCRLAQEEQLPVNSTDACLGSGQAKANTEALSALSRIEGSLCYKGESKYHKALAIQSGSLAGVIESAIAMAIGNETIESYSTFSFWDKLVGQFCPTYGMAVLPRHDTALVVADTPGYNKGHWRTLKPTEYDFFDMSAELVRPLQGVSVVAGWDSQTMGGVEEDLPGPAIRIGGCYVEDSVQAGDGVRMYIRAPSWLLSLRNLTEYGGSSSGTRTNAPTPTSTTPDATAPAPKLQTPAQIASASDNMYDKYAKSVYVKEMLRGRVGTVSGKLRFDVAPGSVVRIESTPEKFIGGEDQLAIVVFGSVQRVTITINAEASLAGTSLSLAYVRSEEENKRPRTSVDEHPLFGQAVVVGAPLVDAYAYGK
jgi:hypothetical protein